MNYKLRILTWPLILAFLPALFGGLGQNLQQLFHFGPATSSVAQVSQSADQGVYVQTICSSSNSDIEEGNTGTITSSMVKTTATLNYNQNLKIWAAVADKPDGVVDSAPVVSIREGSNRSLKSYYRLDTAPHREIMTFCGGTKSLTVDLGWTKNTPPTCTGGQAIDPTTNTCKCPPPLILGSDGKCQGPLTLTVKVTSPSQPNPDGSYFTSDKINIQATVAGGPSGQTYTYAWLKNNKALDPLADDYTTGSSYSSRLSAGSYNFMAVVTAKTSGQTANGSVSFSVKAGTAPVVCLKDNWNCSQFLPETCPSTGQRTRTCNLNQTTITCPSVAIPKPSTSQGCVPGVKVDVKAGPNDGDTFSVANLDLFFYTNFGIKPSGHQFVWSVDDQQISDPSQPDLNKHEIYQPTLSVGQHTISVIVDPNTAKLKASKKVTMTAAEKICSTVPTDVVLGNLLDGLPVQVPSSNLAGWVSTNQAAVKNAITKIQKTCTGSSLPSLNLDSAESFFQTKNVLTNRGLPTPMIFFGLTKGAFSYNQQHEMLMLSSERTGEKGNYSFKALDPNGPSVRYVSCKPQFIFLNIPPRIPSGLYKLSVCTVSGYSGAQFIVYGGGEALDDLVSDLANHSVRENPTKWLESNYTNINNGDIDPLGVCAGWSEFNVRMAYLMKDCKP
jgi:hypothetical protein